MAWQEADREDLVREATALVRRAELTRRRTKTETKLVRSDLKEQQCDEFLAEMAVRMEQWRQNGNDCQTIFFRVILLNNTGVEINFAMAIQRILNQARQKTDAARFRRMRLLGLMTITDSSVKRAGRGLFGMAARVSLVLSLPID